MSRARRPAGAQPALALAVPDTVAEELARAAGWARVAGVDEAGRGPLAGPVVAAAVVLPALPALPPPLLALRDSKALPPAERERLLAWLCGTAAEGLVTWGVGWAEPAEIDRLNILRATHAAMARALAALSPPADGALVDGLPVAGLPCPHRALVRGDATCLAIAAASVVAKVTRDRRMQALDEEYPGYGFARHKGYPTPEHLRALEELGPSPCHRRSFAPVARCAAVLPDGPVAATARRRPQ